MEERERQKAESIDDIMRSLAKSFSDGTIRKLSTTLIRKKKEKRQ